MYGIQSDPKVFSLDITLRHALLTAFLQGHLVLGGQTSEM